LRVYVVIALIKLKYAADVLQTWNAHNTYSGYYLYRFSDKHYSE